MHTHTVEAVTQGACVHRQALGGVHRDVCLGTHEKKGQGVRPRTIKDEHRDCQSSDLCASWLAQSSLRSHVWCVELQILISELYVGSHLTAFECSAELTVQSQFRQTVFVANMSACASSVTASMICAVATTCHSQPMTAHM
jgi:hypothetical protein